MITATVLTKNSEKTLKDTLDSLTRFPEVIVLDSGSTDGTLAIAAQYPNVTTHTSPFLGFGPMHNYAAKLSSHDWVLSIDSDEVLSSELAEEIHALTLDPDILYKINRQNYFNGKHIKWCGGWHPDFVSRLYHRKSTNFSEDLVHEKVLAKKLKTHSLKQPLHHTPYQEIGDFLDKMQLYTRLFAEQRQDQTGSVWQALLHGWSAFIKSYIFKRGFLGGKEGFIISMYNGHTAFYKYLRIALKN